YIDATFRDSRPLLQVTHYPSDKVTTHTWCRLETRHKVVFFSFLRFYRHVAKNSNVLFSGKGDVKSSFCFGFVDTRKGLARVMTLELSCKKFLFLAVNFKIAWVNTIHIISNCTGVLDNNNMFTR